MTERQPTEDAPQPRAQVSATASSAEPPVDVEACDWCGSTDLWWRNCKLLCRSCSAIVKSCSDM